MSQRMDDMLDTASSIDERMEVDTSFLDAYRRGGTDELRRIQAETQDRTEPDPGEDSDLDRLTPDTDPAPEPDVRSRGHGGSSGGAAGSTAEMIPGSPSQDGVADAVPRPQDDAGCDSVGIDIALDRECLPDAGGSMHPRADNSKTTPASLQLTDHQDAVQNAAAKGGSGGSDAATLPQSGFRLGGVRSQPSVRALPNAVVNALREQLRSAAVRELAVDDAAAREFSERLSQAGLVTAFLLAQLDLALDVDASTQRAVELFRSRDPLLGSIAARLDGLERLEIEKRELLGTLREELAEVRQTAAVIEQSVAYSIADRSENFLRGSHNVHDAPITHKDALFVRDRAREATRKQQRIEREREGRPIR